MKLAAVCSTGLGSSFMVEMNITEILKNLGITGVEATHMDMGSASPSMADHFFVGRHLADAAQNQLGTENVTVLDSIIDKDELKTKVVAYLQANNAM